MSSWSCLLFVQAKIGWERTVETLQEDQGTRIEFPPTQWRWRGTETVVLTGLSSPVRFPHSLEISCGYIVFSIQFPSGLRYQKWSHVEETSMQALYAGWFPKPVRAKQLLTAPRARAWTLKQLSAWRPGKCGDALLFLPAPFVHRQKYLRDIAVNSLYGLAGRPKHLNWAPACSRKCKLWRSPAPQPRRVVTAGGVRRSLIFPCLLFVCQKLFIQC